MTKTFRVELHDGSGWVLMHEFKSRSKAIMWTREHTNHSDHFRITRDGQVIVERRGISGEHSQPPDRFRFEFSGNGIEWRPIPATVLCGRLSPYVLAEELYIAMTLHGQIVRLGQFAFRCSNPLISEVTP